MKAVNVSYPDPKRWAALVGIAGPRLGTWDRVRALLAGTPVATPRVQWHGCSDPDLQSLIDATPDVKWLNAERTRGGLLLYFRVRHSRQVTRVPIAECIPLGKPLAPVAQMEDPRQEILPFLKEASL